MLKFPFSFSKKNLLWACLGLGVCNQATAQVSQLSGFDPNSRPILTSVPFLNFALDSRATAMGDVGVATSADANSIFWNASKTVFAKEKYSAGFSFNPWLRGIGVTDMYVANLSGYAKIKENQAVGGEIRYFNLGDIQFTDNNANVVLNFVPREFAVTMSYARKLSEQFSMSVAGKFINSNLAGDFSNGGLDAKPGRSIAADIGMFYTIPELRLGAKTASLNLGANISNIGQKISYVNNGTTDFLPGNLRLGAAMTLDLDPLKKNQLTFAMDVNKLLAPSPAKYDAQGKYVKGDTTRKSLISGVMGSFTDAPDGFSEELKEFTVSGGVEYWYNQTFAARVGYFNESKDKGNRKYFTLGAGFRSRYFGIDVSYLVPQATRTSALDGTLRFSLIGFFDGGNKAVGTGVE